MNANIPLVGISVLEVLNSLFTHLIKSLQGRAFRDEAPDPSDTAGTLEYAVHQGYAHSIGGLASQTYYQNQLNDVTGYIIAKLRTGTLLDQIEGLPIDEYRRVALTCLDLIVSTSKEATSATTTGAHDNHDVEPSMFLAAGGISLSSWLPALGLLTDKCPDTRVDFAESLTRFLELSTTTTSEQDDTREPYPKHLLNSHGDVMFVNALQQTIIDWVCLPNCSVSDMGAIYTLLCTLTRRFGVDGTIRNVPLVFKIQSLVKEGAIKQTSRQRALAAATVEWFGMVANMHQVSRLADYLKQLKDERIAHKEYSPLFIPEIAETVAHIREFDELEPENTTPVDRYIDRHVVVEILSNDGNLRDEEDTHGLDLESKLYVEWGSEAFGKLMTMMMGRWKICIKENGFQPTKKA